MIKEREELEVSCFDWFTDKTLSWKFRDLLHKMAGPMLVCDF